MRFKTHIGLIALACFLGTGSSRGETTIDALFQNAMEQVDQVSRAESIVALEEIISKDRDYAPAYNELAKLHLLGPQRKWATACNANDTACNRNRP